MLEQAKPLSFVLLEEPALGSGTELAKEVNLNAHVEKFILDSKYIGTTSVTVPANRFTVGSNRHGAIAHSH